MNCAASRLRMHRTRLYFYCYQCIDEQSARSLWLVIFTETTSYRIVCVCVFFVLFFFFKQQFHYSPFHQRTNGNTFEISHRGELMNSLNPHLSSPRCPFCASIIHHQIKLILVSFAVRYSPADAVDIEPIGRSLHRTGRHPRVSHGGLSDLHQLLDDRVRGHDRIW